ncbi:hypothetical protein TEA_022538 [Camellia sinensis var. sinensis]|uniref:Histone H2A/H2B/H3 domain-containing protein n=1 Tax=Camellia sinensis var. sinensis TaxID=542762 RepID=A0A4S4F2X5_CAMSN|nr:hypothetical protein TEA_022538 [Camellia sinensis var. sinensis]
MDLKNSNEFSGEEEASSTPQGGQMHNFMSMPSYSLPRNLPPHQVFLQPIELQQQLQTIQLQFKQLKELVKPAAGDVQRMSKCMKLRQLQSTCGELTIRAWLHTQENRRRTLHGCDIARAIRNSSLLDFLVDVVRELDDDHPHQVTRYCLPDLSDLSNLSDLLLQLSMSNNLAKSGGSFMELTSYLYLAGDSFLELTSYPFPVRRFLYGTDKLSVPG